MNKEVQFIGEDIVKIDKETIRNMKLKADKNASGKLRYCFHESENADMQEMLFVVPWVLCIIWRRREYNR